MPTRVQLADGRVVTVETDDPEEAARAAHRFQQQNPAEYPGWRAQSVEDFARGAPSPSYRRAYDRETARQRLRYSGPGGRTKERLLGWQDQMPRNMGIADEAAAATAFIGQGAENLLRRVTGRPIEVPVRDAMRAASDYQNAERARFAEERPVSNAVSHAANFVAFGGRPVANPTRVGVLEAGTAAAGINAPFALARQEGSLPERLPGAAAETAAVFGFGTGLQGLANRFTATPRPNSAAARAQQFEQAGVRSTLAAVQGGAPAGATRMISENFIAGAPARRRLQESLDDTAQAARNLSAQYGQHGQPEQVGEMVQRGVQRFARDRDAPPPPQGTPAAADPASIPTRDWSFRAKSEAVYDRVFQRIARDEQAHLAGETGVRAMATHTQAALQQIQTRVQAPNVAEIVNDPTIGRIARALSEDADSIRFGDLRALRTWVREQRARPSLTQNIDEAALASLERALTRDIYDSALAIGDQSAAHALRRADQFYRAGQQRIQSALQAFDPNRGGGAQAYQRIVALAREGGRQNTRQLQQLRNSLRPDEWRQVAASVIDDMGRPTAGNPGVLEPGAFSVEQFVTNYAKLSEEGRRILFGGPGRENLAAALDNLAQVAGYQKGVERMVNASRSGVNVQNFGSIAGLANPGTTMPTAGLLAGMAITGEIMTNPAFVRWLVSAIRADGAPGGMRRQIAVLATIAARDPAVAPFYSDLAQRVTGHSQTQATPQPQRIGSSQ